MLYISEFLFLVWRFWDARVVTFDLARDEMQCTKLVVKYAKHLAEWCLHGATSIYLNSVFSITSKRLQHTYPNLPSLSLSRVEF